MSKDTVKTTTARGKFFDSRMKLLKFDPKVHTAFFDTMPGEVNSITEKPIFEEDKYGNILLHYFDLNRNIIQYPHNPSKNKKSGTDIIRQKIFSAKRFQNTTAGKYAYTEKGIGPLPYHSFTVCNLWQKKRKIKKLFITEGQFKVFYAGTIHNLPVIGLPGITVWKKKEQTSIFSDIRQVITDCQVEEITFLTDADTLDVTWEEDKDLYKRPNSFATAVIKFKELCEEFNDIDLYFAHIVTSSDHKGLDDLLIANEGKEKAIFTELKSINAKSKYFTKQLITTRRGIRKYFKIDSYQAFYKEYEDVIGNKRFIFGRGQYQLDEDTSEVLELRSSQAAQYLYIGNDIYKKGVDTGEFDQAERVLVKVSAGKLKKECDMNTNMYNSIMRQMESFDGYKLIPAHGSNYEYFKITEDEEGNKLKFYNRYKQVSWMPREGDYTHSLQFIKHIFGNETLIHNGQEIKSWELGLDYMKLLWERPWQMLPILCPVSEERQTGKTTFCVWIRMIFQRNVAKVTNDILSSGFNSTMSGKLLAYCEETFLEKKAVSEKLKEMSTAATIASVAKGKDAEEERNIIKFILCSNNSTNFVNVDEDEIRYWVREIPTLPKSQRIYNILEILNKEIPAFLHFLEQRKLSTGQESRAWFADELIETDALRKLKQRSRYGLELEIESWLQEYFSIAEKAVIKMNIKDMKDLMDNNKEKNSYYKTAIEDKMKIYPTTKGSDDHEIYKVEYSELNDKHELKVYNRKRKCYRFFAHEYFEAHELLLYFSESELINLEKMITKHDRKTFYMKLRIENIKASCSHLTTKKDCYAYYINEYVRQHKDGPQQAWNILQDLLNTASTWTEFSKGFNKIDGTGVNKVMPAKTEEDLPF